MAAEGRRIRQLAALLCFSTLLCFHLQTSEAKVRHYKWEVKYEFKSPDCYRKLVITINGGTPGPTIIAQQNDTVVVDVKNNLGTENLAIHWHGIRQIGSPWADGTEGVTQCLVLPGDTFRYTFIYKFPVTLCHPCKWQPSAIQALTICIRDKNEVG
ncbi:unnamed protein product [Linum tenue]|uniref:Plastocyanin-like domain-containing protein n=1 Tax=Linum tenue TaxID=586396 RepID=A0AAV0P8D8_9ROSI|nr:unnamed protein product [Linum tenue]